MTRSTLVQLIALAPVAAVFGRIKPAGRDATMSLYLGPGRYIIGERGGIWVSGHAVRIEGCTFDGSKVVVTHATDSGSPTVVG